MSDSEYSDDDEICTECPADLERTKKRFQAPYMLAQAGIPCLILGADTLALVFWVPTFGSALHIVVADNFMDRAFELITQQFSYRIAGPRRLLGTEIMLEQESGYLNCKFLESASKGIDPPYILIHPETDFNFSVQDYTRSTPVDEFLDTPFHHDIRLPTRKLVVDIIIDTLLHPEANLVVTQQGFMELAGWLVEIVYRTSLRPLVDGELNSEAQALFDSLKEENRPFFAARFKDNRGNPGMIEAYQERRRVFMMNNKINTPPISQCRPNILCSEQYGQIGFPVSHAGPPLPLLH